MEREKKTRPLRSAPQVHNGNYKSEQSSHRFAPISPPLLLPFPNPSLRTPRSISPILLRFGCRVPDRKLRRNRLTLNGWIRGRTGSKKGVPREPGRGRDASGRREGRAVGGGEKVVTVAGSRERVPFLARYAIPRLVSAR